MSRGVHGVQPGCCDAPPAVAADHVAATARPFTAERKAARATASTIFATVATGSFSAVARALGVSSTVPQRWADPEHESALTLGDLLAAPPVLAEGVLLAALAHVRARKLGAAMPAPERVLRVAGSASDLVAECVRAARDGRIDNEERARLLGGIRELERELAPTYSALAGETD